MTLTAAVGLSGALAEFTAAVENYDRFMGRYAIGLAPKFADAGPIWLEHKDCGLFGDAG